MHKYLRKNITQVLQHIYPGEHYRYWIADNGSNTIKNYLVKPSEICDIHETFYKFAPNHYISVNEYKNDENGWPVKTNIITKAVIDLDNEFNPDKTIKDARVLNEFLLELGYNPMIMKSGKKGIHIHILLDRVIGASDESIKRFWQLVAHKLDITSMDEKVIKDQTARVTRLVGSRHGKTRRGANIVDIYSADTIEDLNFISPLEIKMTRGHGDIEKFYIKTIEKEQSTYTKRVKKPEFDDKYQIQNWNVLDKIYPILYETGKHVSDSKYIVKCPFHADNNPSAFYNDYMFHCSSCNINKGTYNFLVELMGMDKRKALELIRSVQ